MRVNNQALEAFSQGTVNRASQTKPAESRPVDKVAAPASSEAATVAISDEARQLALAAQAESTDRIAALKEAVDNGSFQIDSRMIAKRILDHLA